MASCPIRPARPRRDGRGECEDGCDGDGEERAELLYSRTYRPGRTGERRADATATMRSRHRILRFCDSHIFPRARNAISAFFCGLSTAAAFNDSALLQPFDAPMVEDFARYRYRWERITELTSRVEGVGRHHRDFPEAVWDDDLRFTASYSHDPITTAICRLEALKTALNVPDGHSRQCQISTLNRYGGEARRAGGERAVPFNLKANRFGFTFICHISQKPVFVTFREIG